MTSIAPTTASSSAASTSGVQPTQRQSLEQLVRLSIECTAEERRLEEQHDEALALENGEHKKKIQAIEQRHERKLGELAKGAAERAASIQAKFESRRQALEEETKETRLKLTRTKEGGDIAIKKEAEKACWEAESVLVTFEIKIDQEEQKAKKEQEASEAELRSLGELEARAQASLARYKADTSAPAPVMDDPLKAKLAANRLEVLAEYRPQAEALLKRIESLTEARVLEEIVPPFLILVAGIGAGAAGWVYAKTADARLWTAGGAAAGAVVLGILIFVLFRMRSRKRVRVKARALYEPFMQALGVAKQAAWFDAVAAAAERERRVKEARQKRDELSIAAKDKGRGQLVQGAEQYRAAMATEVTRYNGEVAASEEKRARSLEELQQEKSRIGGQLDKEYAEARDEAERQHRETLEAVEKQYRQGSEALHARWNSGLRSVNELLMHDSGTDPRLVDWNSPAWGDWQSPEAFTGRIRFGEMKVNLAQLTAELPKRLQLPEAFNVPALLTFPTHASLLVDYDQAGRAAAIHLAQTVMARLLTQMPAGRVKFTLIDPVGLGQSFAGFMHLADHDESLVGSRIWTEKEHIHQRLTDLTEHMETVIQKYLRNEYATIDEYNAQAGELAEPIRFLVIADFPTGFEQESLRRLASIITTGPRCGVFTLILHDVRQQMPQGGRLEDIVARSVHLQFKGGSFMWNDEVFKKFPLSVDAAPDERVLTGLMDAVGKAAKAAKRVEVPFAAIAPAEGQFWSLSSQHELRVPIGKSGATRLQALRLGVGVAQHALVAGKTGSGKSNLMHTIVTNMAMWYGPDEVEFYLVDFKKGVEFKAYVSSELPHARAIAVESDREFGLSVLHRVDAELTRRGVMFRDAGVQEIGSYREKSGQKLPRTVLLIDEFQEFFTEDDKIGQEAAGLMDRLVRQGRAFGVHLVLGSQTIAGGSGLGRSTLGQVAVRVALQCSEADSQLILGDNNSAARLLTRPGEAIYNDAGGLVEANSPFQIAFLPNRQREEFLEKVHRLSLERRIPAPAPIVFEGNSAAAIRKNEPLMARLEKGMPAQAGSVVPAYLGEPVAIKEPTAVPFRRQGGSNVLLVGQQEESALGIFASMVVSLAAQHPPGGASFYLMDGSAADSRFAGKLEQVLGAIPHPVKVVAWRDVPDAINELATSLQERQTDESKAGASAYLLVFGLQRYRLLRRQEEDFSFSKGEEAEKPKPDKQFAELLSEGPALGIHTVIWADTPITIERTLERAAMRQFDWRVLFQMSANDSSNLIDSPAANRLGGHRALLYSEEQGTLEKFRPYEVPDEGWLALVRGRLVKG